MGPLSKPLAIAPSWKFIRVITMRSPEVIEYDADGEIVSRSWYKDGKLASRGYRPSIIGYKDGRQSMLTYIDGDSRLVELYKVRARGGVLCYKSIYYKRDVIIETIEISDSI